MNDTLVLIPTYKPDDNLLDIAARLFSAGFRILVADDGSGDAYSDILEKLSAYATVIGYDDRRGRGFAIKYGLDVVLEQMSYFKYLIIADPTCTFTALDVNSVSEAVHKDGGIVVGARDLKRDVGILPRIYNGFMRTVYSLMTGVYVTDVMSGLRAFEMKYLRFLMDVEGDGLDYETNVIIEAAKRRFPIATISNSRSMELSAKKSVSLNMRKDVLPCVKSLFFAAWPSLGAMMLNFAVMLAVAIIAGKGYASVAAGVFLGSIVGIAASVFLNNRVGYEENFDGALSYNRIMMGMLRFCLYLLFMEFFGVLLGIGMFLALIITVLFTMVIEMFVMREGLDKDLRLQAQSEK